MSLAEKYGPWAIIAGASEGTGAAFARRLAADGVHCILIARREGPLAALADELRAQYGVECVTASIDLGASDALDRIVAATGDREVGLFINNAGADANDSLFLENQVENWRELVDRNVVNPLYFCYHFAGLMKARRRGGIILVGSGACYGGASGMAVYSATKAFDLCLGEGLWAELRPYGVDVLNLILGRTNTPAYQAFMANRGQSTDGAADPDDVAKLGLERLPHGPVQNWGAADGDTGFAPTSAADRRAKILLIDSMSGHGVKAE